MDQGDEDDVMLAGPVHEGDRQYFCNHVPPNLRPLSDEEYMQASTVRERRRGVECARRCR